MTTPDSRHGRKWAKFTYDERERFRKRMRQLMAENTPEEKIVNIMQYEGYRKPNGMNLDRRFIQTQKWNMLNGKQARAARKGELPEMKTVYEKPEKSGEESLETPAAPSEKERQAEEVHRKLSTITVLLEKVNDPASCVQAVKAVLGVD